MRKEPPLDEKVVKVIDDFLRERMGRWGYTGVRARPDVDYDGDPVLRIDADYEYRETPMDVYALVGLISDLSDALEKVDEYRFPMIRHHFDPRQTTTKFVSKLARSRRKKTA